VHGVICHKITNYAYVLDITMPVKIQYIFLACGWEFDIPFWCLAGNASPNFLTFMFL